MHKCLFCGEYFGQGISLSHRCSEERNFVEKNWDIAMPWRLQIATAAMQGMLSANIAASSHETDLTAVWAIKYADALLAKFNEPTQKGGGDE